MDEQGDRRLLYEIRIRGCLDTLWADWFDGFVISYPTLDETLLVGRVTDQAALYGLLAKIHNLGLPLLSLRRLAEEEQT
jgi:hypothetical protein